MNRKISKVIVFICWGIIYFFLSGCGGKLAGPENDKAQFDIKIEYMRDAYLGHYRQASIEFAGDFSQITALDLRITYDPAYVDFVEGYAGGLLIDNKWEYFTYSYIPPVDSGDIKTPPLLHLYAFNNISFDPVPLQGQTDDSTSIAVLTFITKNNHDNDCSFSSIRFYWEDCYDNLLFTDFPDSAICATAVYDTGQLVWSGNVDEFGIGIIPSLCAEDSQVVFSPTANFINGGFGIICDSLINDHPWYDLYTIATAVMMTNYFISGPAAFGSQADYWTENTDFNANGTPLEVGDLVYLVRVIVGDALPYLTIPDLGPVEIIHFIDGENNSIYYESPYDLGAMLLEFDVTSDLFEPILIDNAADMDIVYHNDSGQFRILVFNIGTEKIEEGNGGILGFQSAGEVNLNYAEISHYHGENVPVEINDEPVVFELMQNYPNPFSSSTAIQIALAFESDWAIEIFNIYGETIRKFNGHSAPGMIEIIWDGKDDHGNDVPGGVYFYRATVCDQIITKKMMLLRDL
ncbi:MAG: T9SS type A sorting domain-containing protein [candidate division Zixibacteria bacterium]